MGESEKTKIRKKIEQIDRDIAWYNATALSSYYFDRKHRLYEEKRKLEKMLKEYRSKGEFVYFSTWKEIERTLKEYS